MFLGSIRRLHQRQEDAPIEGAIDEISADHVAGWMLDPADPDRRVAYEVVCTRTGQILGGGVADQYRHHLNFKRIGDAANGFHARLSRPPATSGGLAVRPVGGKSALPVAEAPRTSFEPLLHVAMDVVDNCNLRCPFCLYDYAGVNTTHFMTEQTLESALRLLPYVRDGQFWFSCLHEPTLHPQLTAFIDKVPREYRRKVFYTTNLAKRMPESYFAWLAQSGLYNINISIESRDPAVYERMRKGARHRIFQENWDRLLDAFARVPAPPKLRYIAMAYKSNLEELPGLASYLLEERQAWQVEYRYTFDLPYIPEAFRQAEFLDEADWAQLRERLPSYPIERLLLLTPPAPGAASAAPAAPVPDTACLPDYYTARLSWDGSLRVGGIAARSRRDQPIEREFLTGNINEMGDARAFIDSLASAARA